jgi:hypothetical protein
VKRTARGDKLRRRERPVLESFPFSTSHVEWDCAETMVRLEPAGPLKGESSGRLPLWMAKCSSPLPATYFLRLGTGGSVFVISPASGLRIYQPLMGGGSGW